MGLAADEFFLVAFKNWNNWNHKVTWIALLEQGDVLDSWNRIFFWVFISRENPPHANFCSSTAPVTRIVFIKHHSLLFFDNHKTQSF